VPLTVTSGRPTPDEARWERIEEVCFNAMSLKGQARSAFLDKACADDPELKAEVEALVRASDARPDFLSRPIISLPGGIAIPHGADASSGEVVGPYRLVRPLGHGGMGDVYLAVRHGDGFSRTVALKLIRRGIDTDRVLDRFRQERRILAELRHPNIASLIDGGATEDGRPYFVMEFVEGEPIDAYCERKQLDVRERLDLVRPICFAVAHAHQNLVVHRDIKPANILVTENGVPKLLDFGIGKVLAEEGHSEAPVTVFEERALTPEYAAPEQIEGKAITTATDVFGLGALLYRLLTSRPPWEVEGADRQGVLEARSRDPAPPSAIATGRRSAKEVDAIVLKALRADPHERYPSPLALADDIERFLEGRPVRARRPSAAYTVHKFVARHRVAVSAALVLGASLVGVTAYTWTQSQRVAAERDKALEVRGFLLETFGAAGPERVAGDPVTARTLLDRQAETVLDQYADDPELRAEMMMVLGEGYERLGLFAEADRWAARVVEESDALGPVERATARTLLGWIRHQQGRSQEAEALLSEAVEGARRARGADRTLARALNDLGVVHEALGAYEAALAAHQEAMALRRTLFGPRHRSVAVSASNIAVIYYRMGDLPAAVAETERALELMRVSFGPDHQRAIIVQSNLAVFKMVQGDLAGAETDYRDLLARQRRLQGERHPVAVRVMMSLAGVLAQQEKWREAESVLGEALQIQRASAAPNRVEVAFSTAMLGNVISAGGGRHGEAVPLIEDALRVQIEALGSAHVEVAQSRNYLSRAYERVDSIDVAVRWQEEAVTALASSLGPDHPRTVSERDRLRALRERLQAR